MPFFYASGEEIKVGDRIKYGTVEGEVELIADPAIEPNSWYVTEHGGGVMVTAYGSVFIADPNEDDDLVFLSRREQGL